jgi:hypothetical protein
MTIRYIDPLSRGISRTDKSLFKPFRLNKWWAVGFTAFLAELGDVGFKGGMNIGRGSKIDVEEVFHFPQKAWEWLIRHPGWAVFIAILTFLAIIFGIIISWLSARGKFMFLDNVVKSRSRIVAPWHEYRKEANSFFLFNLVWGFIQLPIVAAYLIYCFLSLQAIYTRSGNSGALVIPAILAGCGLVAGAIFSLFIYLLLKDFVVPIMYRNRITTWQAIQKFFPLLLSNFIYFMLYALFLVCLWILIVLAIFVAALITCCFCCIGLLVLMIPYINSVILLPISYALRCFSVEFLGQFGPDYILFPRQDVIPPDPGPIAV